LSSYHLDKERFAKLTHFINSLNKLLREHKMSIEFSDGALFSNLSGYLGQLEDNADHLILSDGDKDIVTSNKEIDV